MALLYALCRNGTNTVNRTIISASHVSDTQIRRPGTAKKNCFQCFGVKSAFWILSSLSLNNSALCLCLQKSVICGPHGLGWWPACRATICRCSLIRLRDGFRKQFLLCRERERESPTSKWWFHDRACGLRAPCDVKVSCYRVYSLHERSTPACSIYWHAVMQLGTIT